MRTATQHLFCLVALTATVRGGELEAELTHGQSTSSREDVWSGHVSFSFDGRNGHIEVDVRFDLKRIALTGTSTHVTVLDFDGNVIAEKRHATRDRNMWIEFSPVGDRLLVGSCDNTVRVFRIVE